MKTIYLCGFMGCGKTTVGKALAKKLGYGFTDLDSYIVQEEGCSIPEIFAQKGEAYFRQLETKALADLSCKGNTVVATGGGALVSEANGKLARENGIVLFLDVPFSVCYSRIAGDSNRPLVVNNTKSQLEAIYEERIGRYRKNATLTICTQGRPAQVAEAIKRQLKLIGQNK